MTVFRRAFKPARYFRPPVPGGFLLAVLWACSLPLLAIEGRVVDATTRAPIPYAEISILGHSGSVHADAEGCFTWKPAPVPPFEVLVLLPGERLTKPQLIDRLPREGVWEVAVSTLVDEHVTVTSGLAPDITSTPAAATVLVPSQELARWQPANLVQALEQVTGASLVSEGHAAVPAIRGLARGRTLIMIDGARVTSDRRVGPSAGYLDPFVLEGIEVARGPGSVAYGSDAFGGVINARTRRVVPNAPLGARFAGSLGLGAPQQRLGLELSKGTSLGGVIFQAHYRDLQDYSAPAREIYNSGSTDQGFLGQIEQRIGKGIFSIVWQSDFGQDIGRPRNNSRVVRFYYPIEDSHRLTTRYDMFRAAGFERISLMAFLGTYHQVTDQDRFSTAASGRQLERADYSADDFQFRGSVERNFSRARLVSGFDFGGRFNVAATDTTERYDTGGSLTTSTQFDSIEQAGRSDVGVFAVLETALAERVSLGSGIRGDRVTSRNEGGYFGDRTTSQQALSGNASLTYSAGKGISLTGQVSRGFRDPTVSDRYYRGPTGRGFITGNPDLDPERSLQFDLGLRYTSARIRTGFFGYEYRIHDLIERYQTEPDNFAYRNRGQARLRGLEAEIQMVLSESMSLQGSVNLVRGQALDDGVPLDDIPPLTFSMNFRRSIGERAFVQALVSCFDSDGRPGPTEVRMPGYSLLGATAGFKLTEHLNLNLTVRNLLDQTYPLSPDSRAVPAPGLNTIVTLLASF